MFIANGFAQEIQHDCLNQSHDDVDTKLTACLQAYYIAKKNKAIDQLIELTFITVDLYQLNKSYHDSNALLHDLLRLNVPQTNTVEVQYKLLRKLGQNHYFLKNYSQALLNFQKAFDLAKLNNQLVEMAKSYNDLGIVYKVQSGYSDALNAYLQSLKIKEALNLNKEIGNTLYNIGNIYILIHDYASAYDYQHKALEHFLQKDNVDKNFDEMIVHVKGQIGVALEKIQGLDAAISYLELAIEEAQQLENSGVLLFEMYCTLANFYVSKGQVHHAKSIIDQVVVTEQTRPNQRLLRLMVLTNIAVSLKAFDMAESHALVGLNLAKQFQNGQQVTDFLLVLAEIKHQTQDYQLAYDYKSQYIQSKASYLQQRYDTSIKYLQNEIEIQQQQQNLKDLQKSSEIQALQINKQRLQNWLIILINVLLFSLIIWLVIKKNKEKKRLLIKVNYHRKKLKDMQAPKEKLRAFFQAVDEPLICLDQMGVILFFNQHFQKNYIQDQKELQGQKFEQVYPRFSHTLSQVTFDSNDMPNQQHIIHRGENEKPIHMWINTLNFFDNVTVISFQNNHHSGESITQTQQLVENANLIENLIKKMNSVMKDNNPAMTHQLIKQLDEKLSRIDSKESRSENYRLSLVNLMSVNLEIWRKSTHGDRVSLAEKSCIWRVTIDDGRLRTRAMDRYLSLKLLPKSPRWRPVVKTTHYILSECKLTEDQRRSLSQLLEVFMAHLRSRSLQN